MRTYHQLSHLRIWAILAVALLLSGILPGTQRTARADSTAFALCTGTTANIFSQDWTNASLITTNDDWSGVPSIVGYRGDGMAGAAGVDPQTVTGNGTVTIDVNANQTNPDSFNTGGVTEFAIANPTIALIGSGTARGPHIVITLNNTGTSATTIAYTVRDIENTADNSTQSFNVQYRIGVSGAWTNVPGGYIADASVGPSLTQNTPVAAYALPTILNNAGTIQLRFMTMDATGNDEWLGVDDIVITPTCNPDPCASVTFPYTLPDNLPETLRTAMECANANGTTDIINLNGQTVTLTDSYGDFDGATGLPRITTSMVIRNGTITRSGSNEFRLLYMTGTGSLVLRDMTLSNGGGATYTADAGILYAGSSSSLTIWRSLITGGTVSNSNNVGGIFSSGTLLMASSRVQGNRAGRAGGMVVQNGPAAINNSVISGNVATSILGGGGLYIPSTGSNNVTITNSTITGNYSNGTSASASGGIIGDVSGPNIVLKNSIVWGNSNNGGAAPQIVNTSGTTTVTNSIVQGGQFGGLNSDPLFTTPLTPSITPSTAGNFQLLDSSPAVDAGANADVPQDTFDADGDSNFFEDAPDIAAAIRRYDDTGVTDTGSGTAPIVDMGAYEKQTNSPDPCAAYVFPYTLTGNTPAELIEAMECANANGTADTIDLNNQTVTLTDSYATYTGATGLPQITTQMTLRNGTITRGGANQFRLLAVSAIGNLTLNNIIATNGYGLAPGNMGGGGAIYNLGALNIVGGQFSSNYSALDGGAIHNDGGAVNARYTVFSGNSSNTSLGGVGAGLANSFGVVTLSNVLISGNLAVQGGGIYNNNGGTLTLNNSTIAGNSTNDQGGGLRNENTAASVVINNTIISGNESSLFPANSDLGGSITNNASLVGGSPSFVAPLDASDNAPTIGGDYRLADFSPAIDAGDNSLVPGIISTDLDTNPRYYDDTGVTDTGSGTAPIVDLGAYEKQTNSVDPCAVITFPYTLPNNLAATLITAIECANANGVSADTIDFNGQIVTLTASYADYTGATGLPQITTPITLESGVITRSGAAPQFRLLNVGVTGDLTLDGITASGGSMPSLDNAGAIFNDGGALNIIDSTITNNSAGFGGALYNIGAGAILTITNSTLSNNNATQNGGFMMNDSGSATITGSTVSGNSSSGGSGNGAIYNFQGTLNLVDSTFVNNTSTTFVGAVQNFNGTTNITNSSFAGNSASNNTGAVMNNSGNMTITNSLFSGNNGNIGGALYNNVAGTLLVVNSTFSGNNAPSAGGIFVDPSSATTITNSIIWGNNGNMLTGATITYSIVEGGFSGTGNLNVNPLFVAPVPFASAPSSSGNYRLQDTSPAVDAGSNAAVPVDTYDLNENANTTEDAPDLDFNPRRYDDTGVTDTGSGSAPVVDMGAYEKQTNSPAASTVDYCNLQFPTSFTLEGGSPNTSPLIYGRIYEDDGGILTSAGGAHPSIVGQVGYGPLGSDPTGNGAWTWVTSTFNTQIGNDDEYQGSFFLPAVGTPTQYSYTMRFSIDSGATFTYCDTDGNGTNGGLSFSTAALGTMTVLPSGVNYCNLQSPTLFAAAGGSISPTIYGRVYEDDAGVLTSTAGAHPSVVGQVGYGPLNSNPTGNPNWFWSPTTYNTQVGNDDEYQGTFQLPYVSALTSYSYTYRFSVDSGTTYTYCDINGNGTDTGLSLDTAQLGRVDVNPAIAPISINDVTLNEGNSGTTNFVFTVSLGGISADTVTVDVTTADGTAQDDVPATEDNDYVPQSQSLTFVMGETSKTFTVAVNGDTAPELDESFFVNLTNIVNATPTDTQGQGTILSEEDICTLYTFPYTLTGNTPEELIQAILCANVNGTADVINLNGQTITLTAIYNAGEGTGLPLITTAITIENGTITRSSGTPFRFFTVNSGSNLTLNGVTLTNGDAPDFNHGGAIRNLGTVTLRKSIIAGNQSGVPGSGGGVFNNTGSNLTVINSVISGNYAASDGGGIRNLGTLLVSNSTIAGNRATNGGGGISNTSSATVNSSIVYGNTATSGAEVSGGVISNSTYIGVDPSFISIALAGTGSPTTGGDYHLGINSIAVDSGNNAHVEIGQTTDLDGNPRFYDDTGVLDTGLGTAPIVDMGAYERQTNSPLVCGASPDRIYELQDSGIKFGMSGPFTVDGVVIFDGQASGQWDGFYIQDPIGDGNPATSDGIYIYDPSPLLLDVNVGDYVRVTGTVSEFAQTFSLVTPAGVTSTTETEITATAVTLCGNTATVTPTLITLPFATLNEQEQYEGMLVTFNQTLAVTELFTLGRYGEVSLSLNERLVQPTNYLAPGAAAQAQQAINDRSRILIDDGRKTQNIDPIIYPAPGLSASNTLRHGDTTTSVTGVFTQANSRFGNGTSTNPNPFRYRVNTTATVNFTPTNPRPTVAPNVGGTLRVASMNLLNYFNTFSTCFQGSVVIDGGTGEPTPGPVTYTNGNCRGANNTTEFTRQRTKTIAAILKVNAAVIGINELENDIPNDNGGANGPTTAIEDLVNGLNAATAPGTYAFINTGRIGTDAIRVGMIYQPALVTPVGAHAILGNVQPFNRNTRPALAQTFEEVSSGEQFTMVANHFKSKGSCPAPADFHYSSGFGNNFDTGDGQACWNADRLEAAEQLTLWLATNPTGTSDPDYLILGDLNSYAAEDPISYLTSNGYSNLIATYVGAGDEAYSYVFDGQSGYLDHALANAAILSQVTGAAEYHINADEPTVLDYNTEFKSAGQVTSLYAPDEFRVSDHDPVIVGLSLASLDSADLSITKTDGVTTAVPGGSVTYTITASNAGPDAVIGATVADTLPAVLTGTWTCVGAGGGTCTAAGAGNIGDTVNLPVGGSVTYTVTATISASATGTLSNTATVSSAVTDPNPANNSATDSDTLTPQADLAITKTDGVTTAVPGGSVTYTITASNAGPSNAPGATVADTFPAVLTGTWTCVGAGGGTCTAAGSGNISDTVNLPAGGSVTYTVTATISASATGTLSNTATVSSAVTDPNPANNSATDSDTLTPQADLSITKTDGVTTVNPGGSVTYTITASNAGPSNAPGATVADTFPATLTGTWTCVGAGGGTCTAAGSGNISDTVNLPAGGSVTYTVSAILSGSATGTLSNTATVAAPGGVTDPVPGNNSATDSDTITSLGLMADLAVTKTDGVTTAVPGGSVTYTITASNAGPDPVSGATVADTFPAVLTGTWTCVGAGGGTCTAAGSGNISDTVNLPVGASVTYTATATISAAATGTLSNTATVSSAVTDPNPANNSATDSDTLTPQADLAITKTDGVTTATPGGSVTYTITASNAGPSNTTATVADTFPASLTGTWTCVGAGGGTCTAGPVAGNINDAVNLPAGASVTYTVTASISASATGTLTNTATVSGAVTDPVPGNNSATDSDTLTPQADLAITKTDGVTTVVPGGSVTYTITASNAGPSDAPGATVADTLPAVLTGTWTCVGAGGGTCTAAGSGNISDTVNLPAGSSVTYTVTATISAAATGTLSNTATVSSAVTDPNPANNSATDIDTIVSQADLSITKTDSVTSVNAGGTVTYTITASNAGPSDAMGATVADTLPAVLTGTWTCVGAGGGTCTAAGSGNISDTVNLPAGSSVTYTVTATISAAATGTLSNTATVSSAVTDPNPANNSATDVDTINPVVITELIVNGGFETANPNTPKKAQKWTTKAPSINNDRRVCKPANAFEGNCAYRFRFSGTIANNGSARSIKQVIKNPAVGAGDTLTFSLQVRATNLLRKARAVVTVVYPTGTERLIIQIPTGTYAYTELTNTITLTGTPTRIEVTIEPRKTLGTFFVDAVSLSDSSLRSSQPLADAQALPLPSAPDGFRR